jgi:hypothetical protein
MKNFKKLPESIQKSMIENAKKHNNLALLGEILYDAIWIESDETSLLLIHAFFEVLKTNYYGHQNEFMVFFESEPENVKYLAGTVITHIQNRNKLSKSKLIKHLNELRENI